MRPQHSDVVGDVASIRGTRADVDHGDAAAAWLDEMKGRHLRLALRRAADRTGVTEARIARDDVAGLDKSLIAGFPFDHALAAELCERLSVELVIRKDHEILEILGVSPSVVVEPMQ